MNAIYTLKHLKYFIAVAEQKHFGKAAESCYVTQPTLSAAIKEFEDLLGLQLLERTKRSVLITPIGEEILIQAKEIVLKADALMEFAHSKGAPLSGELKLGIIPTIAPYLLPRLMQKVRNAYPDLTLYLREDQTARLLQNLNNGQLDLLVIALPYEDDGIETFTFMQDPFYCAVPENHPLAKKKLIKSEDLYDENLLLLEEGHCMRQHALAACSWPQNKNTQGFAATSLTTVVQMVANGLGLTLLPQMAIDSGVTLHSSIKTIPMAKDSPPRDIGLAWRKTSGRREEFKTLGTFLSGNL